MKVMTGSGKQVRGRTEGLALTVYLEDEELKTTVSQSQEGEDQEGSRFTKELIHESSERRSCGQTVKITSNVVVVYVF
jgi:hypothetical protein